MVSKFTTTGLEPGGWDNLHNAAGETWLSRGTWHKFPYFGTLHKNKPFDDRAYLVIRGDKIPDLPRMEYQPRFRAFVTPDVIPYSDIIGHFEYNPLIKTFSRHIDVVPQKNPFIIDDSERLVWRPGYKPGE